MTTRPEPLPSEQDVQAYADGLLAADRAQGVSAYLARRPAEARRVAFYARINAQLRANFPGDAPHCAREFIADDARGGRRRRRSIASSVAAAFAAVAVAVATLVPMLANVTGQDLNQAASSLLAATSASSSSAPPAEPSWFDAFRPRPARAPELDAVGFHLASARRIDIGPFATASAFVYRNAAGEPLVLVAAGAPDGGGHWQARRAGTVRLLEWTSRAGRPIVIAGEVRTRGLMRAADLLAGE